MKNLTLCWLWLLSHGLIAQQIRFISMVASDGLKDSVYQLHKPIVLDSKQTHLQFKFIDTSDSLQASYAYQLQGVDNKWHSNGTNRQVTYVNLLGGDYQMQVKNLRFPTKIAIVKFHLQEAFWQKFWFVPMLIGYGLLILGIILYFFRVYKLRSVIRLQQVRNEIASDLHDDVGSTLSNISFLGEMAKMKYQKNPADVLPILERILDNSKEMIQTMRGMVWTINPDNDNARDFIEKIRVFAEAMLANREIRLTFKNEIPENQHLSVEQQRHLFLMFKEIVHNIAKHAKAQKVSITLKKHDQWLWAKVTDDGVGFDTTIVSDGNGLRNLHKRAEQLEGRIEITSTLGQGSIIKLMIPL